MTDLFFDRAKAVSELRELKALQSLELEAERLMQFAGCPEHTISDGLDAIKSAVVIQRENVRIAVAKLFGRTEAQARGKA